MKSSHLKQEPGTQNRLSGKRILRAPAQKEYVMFRILQLTGAVRSMTVHKPKGHFRVDLRRRGPALLRSSEVHIQHMKENKGYERYVC